MSLSEFKVGALIMDPNSGTPIVVLKSLESNIIIPIWVGNFEANAIAFEIEKIASQRPMTHDLMRNMLIQFGFSINRVIINELKNNTFYAIIELVDSNDKSVSIDARPSDAIALALRFDSRIFVSHQVVEISNRNQEISQPTATESPILEEWPDLID